MSMEHNGRICLFHFEMEMAATERRTREREREKTIRTNLHLLYAIFVIPLKSRNNAP